MMASRADKVGDAGDHRLVHLDLKGAPPKISYYEQLFPLLHQWGATGLLVEYEDMFPYWGDLQQLAAPSAYSASEVAELLNLAEQAQLVVIPLVQTFGHFEFVLKHDKFRHLREVDDYPMALCPLHEETKLLIQMMIDQIMQLHPNAKWLHIGADEVYHLGVCPRCHQFLENAQQQQEQQEKQAPIEALVQLFTNHVTSVVKSVKANYPSVSCIMWDDMLRSLDLATLQRIELGNLLELMVWYYQPSFFLPDDLWDRYTSTFTSIWAASAFKGATGPTMCVPDITHHVENHEAWLQIIQQHLQPKCQQFRGFSLTGWQRYDHYAMLCELLPVSVPCLAICLGVLVAGSFKESVRRKASDDLNFTDLIPLKPVASFDNIPSCDFPGSTVYKVAYQLIAYKTDLKSFMRNERLKGWMTDYHIKHNFTNPAHLRHFLPAAEELLERLQELNSMAQVALSEMFYPDTVDEWLTIHFAGKLTKLTQLVENAHKQISMKARVKDYMPEKLV